MNILIAPDAFKDSLSAKEVANAIELGVKRYSREFNCFQLFASDGGEGFLNAVQGYIPELKEISVETFDPLGRPIYATYLWNEGLKNAYIELAKASGIELLSLAERDPLKTSTYGTGLQIKHAIESGAKKIYVGIGGSATNDAGIGMARALGYQFFDVLGNELPGNGSDLNKIHKMVSPKDHYNEIEFFAINDVLNPLFGKTGAAYTYGKQKGATLEAIELLDKGLQNISSKVEQYLKKEEATIPGAGAAGGAAFGLACFFNAYFVSGTSFILNLANFHQLVITHNIKLIITGEGKIDHQTAYGKFVFGIIQEAKRHKIPVMAICGKLDLDQIGVKGLGLVAATQLFDPTQPVSYSFDNAERLISEKTTLLLQQFY